MRNRNATPGCALALVLALILPASAAGAVKGELDRPNGVRLTLHHRVLTAEIVRTPRIHRSPTTEQQLFGKPILGACGSSFRPTRDGVVWNRRVWPAGARRLSFGFGRDISSRARWCLIEHRGGDIAFVSFVDREPARLVAKGRGPSGEWWRLSAWRGEKMEPCMGVRTPAGVAEAFLPCFEDLGDREATLGVSVEMPDPHGDRYVYGAVGRSATAVRVRLADGSVEHAAVYDRPRGSRALARFFMLALPAKTEVSGVRAVDAEGHTVGRERL